MSSPESRRPPNVLLVESCVVVSAAGSATGGAAGVLLLVLLSSFAFFSAVSRSFFGGKSVESVNKTHPSDPSLFLFSLKISSNRGSTNKDSIGSSSSSVSTLSSILFLMRSGDARPLSSKNVFFASCIIGFTVVFVVAATAVSRSLSSLFSFATSMSKSF